MWGAPPCTAVAPSLFTSSSNASSHLSSHNRTSVRVIATPARHTPLGEPRFAAYPLKARPWVGARQRPYREHAWLKSDWILPFGARSLAWGFLDLACCHDG
jgi:hypothetical protein